MLHLIIGLVIFSVAAVVALVKGPSKENDTVNELKERLARQEAMEALNLANEQRAKELEELRKKMRKEEEKRVQAIEKRNQERIEQESLVRDRKDKAEAVRRAEERRRQEAEEKKADEERKRVLERQMKEVERREQELRGQLKEANRLAEQERVARLEAEKGNGPIRWPTREEFDHSLRNIHYDSSNFHFAIVGRAGSGKSSLINAFRNLRNKDPGAAQTGTKETTLEIARYQDPGDQPPRQWMVWFDIPGAGTHRISHHDYFIKQGLYVFDFIILAIGDRFEEIDARILDNCARFKIPTFIVRSKADMHIANSMQEYGFDHLEDDLQCYTHCRETFIHDTNKTVEEELTRQGLPLQTVYIVSRNVLQRTYHASLHTSTLQAVFARPEKNLIHECSLVKALLTAAAQRRCEPSAEQNPLDWVRGRYVAARGRFTGRNAERQPERQDLAEFFAAGQGQESEVQVPQEGMGMDQPSYHHAPNFDEGRGSQAQVAQEVMSMEQPSYHHAPNIRGGRRGRGGQAQVPQEVLGMEQPSYHPVPNIPGGRGERGRGRWRGRGRGRGSGVQIPQEQTTYHPAPNRGRGRDNGVQVSQEGVRREQPTHHRPPNIRKVIYTRETDSHELYNEIMEQNPDIETLVVGLPRMLTPSVAMLTFYPSEEIPRGVRAFGSWLRLAEYEERPKSGAGTGQGGYVHTEAGGPSTRGQRNLSNSARGSAFRGRGRGGWGGGNE